MPEYSKWLRSTVILSVLLLSVFASLITVPEKSEGSQITMVHTSITPASQEVDVSPGSTGSVLFQGSCEAEIYGPLPVVVNLQATVQGGGTAAVSPQSFTLSNQKTSQSLSISVVVPILISRNTQIKVQISGTWKQGASMGDVGGSEAQIIVLQYYKFMVYSDNPYQQISPGDSVVFPLKIENLGNGQDTYVTTIENEEELVSAGWTLTPIPKLTVDEKQFKRITYTVQSPQKWTIWKNKVWMVKLQIISEDSGNTVKESYPLFIRTKGFYIPGFEPAFSILALALLAAFIKRKRSKP